MARRNGSVAADVVKGTIAGLAGTWVMNRVTTYMYEHENRSARRREDRARGGKTAFYRAAEKGAHALGVHPTRRQLEVAAQALHWWIGAEAGVSYAMARRKLRAAGRLRGVGFGTGFWLLVDELANPLLGITKGPRSFPWQAHARGLAGHVAFGLTAHLALDALDRVA